MSRKRKNFHYHYAEQFETREQRLARRRSKRRFAVPPLALVFSIVLLAVFGLVSTTFSVYVTTSFDDPEMPAQGGLVVNIKNGANTDHPESTGIVRNNGEDLADSGADMDLAESGVTWHDDWRATGSNSTPTIYFDNSLTQWSSVNFKIGRNWNYGGDGQGYSIYTMTKVTGTDYIYKVTVDWGKYNDFYFVNGGTDGWHGNTSVRNHDDQYSAFTTPMSFDLGNSTYFFIGQSNSIGTTSSPTEIACYGASGGYGATTASDYTTYQKTVSVANVANGTVTATYKNDSGTNQTISENGSATILIGKTITVKETPSSGYSAGDITVTNSNNSATVTISSGQSVFTSGNGQTTITGSFHVYTPPAATSVSLSKNQTTIYAGITSVTYTATATGAESGVTYNFKVDGTSVQNTTSRTYARTFADAGTYNVTVTVEKSGYDSVTSSAVSTTVTAPVVTFGSCSVEEFKTETLSVTGRTPTPSSYSWSVDSAYSSLISLSNQAATSVKVTAAAYSQATAKVKYTATYSNGFSKVYEATVSITESTLSMKGTFNGENWGINHKLTYDSAANSSYGSYTNRGSNLYSCTLTLSGGQTYDFGFNEGSTFYKNSGTITSDRSDCKIEVSNNNGWGFSTGASNCKITTGAGGSYTFYYNPTNHRLWIGEYPGIEYYLVGFGDWDEDEDTVMTKVSNTQYTYTKTFAAAQSYAYNTNNGFKIACNDGTWYGYDNTISRTNTSVTMTKDGGNNAGFTSSYSGTYTFTFNPSTNALTVTFPTRSITVNAKLNATNTILGSVSNSSTSSAFFTITDNYNDTFTIAPKSHSQYQFTKWRDNNSTTGSRTITVTSSTAVTYDTNWNYKSYTITYNTDGGTLASGTYDSVTTANSVYKSSYTYGTGKTLPTASDITHSTAPSLYSFGGWYANSGLTGNAVTSISTTDTGNKTYWAKWNMQVVFKNNITDNTIATQTVAAGGTASAPDLTSANAAMSALGFEFSGYSTPLTTTINYSWYQSNGNSNVIYVNYIPKARDFSITITPSANVTVDSSGEYDNYLIPFGATIAAHAEVAVPAGYDEDIYIKWIATINGVDYDADYYGDYSDDDPPTYYDEDNGKYVFDRADIVTLLTKVAPIGTYTLKAKAYYDIDGNTTVVSENYVSHTITYQIDSPMSGVTKTPDQKIYTVGAAPDVVASISTHSSISQTYINLLTSYYKVAVLAYDKANATTDKYDEIDGYEELEIEGSSSPFSATFDGVSIGVNYYKFKLKRLEDIEDPTSDLVDDSVSASTRTVVGTNQGAATRPIYVANNSGNAFTGKRVMLFYITDRGTLGYATSTSFNHATAAGGSSDREVYRFDIPGYVESVSIGVFDSSKEYALPTLSGTTLSYTGTNFYTWSNWKEIDSTVQKINISAVTANSQIADNRITTGLLS